MTPTPDEAMPDLLPCPICGGKPEIERIGTMRQSMIIGCTECHCKVESGDVAGMTAPKHYRWNMRWPNNAAAAARLHQDLADAYAAIRDLVGVGTYDCTVPLPTLKGLNRDAYRRAVNVHATTIEKASK